MGSFRSVRVMGMRIAALAGVAGANEPKIYVLRVKRNSTTAQAN